jgi:dihydrofolate reductase
MTVGVGYSISVDGFIAGPNDDVERLFAWMFAGSNEFPLETGEQQMDLRVTDEGAEQLAEAHQAIGAIVAGRRVFDVAGAWGGKHPMNVPVVVVTHRIPKEWAERADSPFTFVTEGVERAVAVARELAGDKTVGVAGADVTRQCLRAGLLDTIHLDVVPVLLGSGVRLFEHLGIEPIELEVQRVVPDRGVTHLTYRVVK